MNLQKLRALGEALKAADEQEQQPGKSAMSRRWFIRALVGTVASAAVLGVDGDGKLVVYLG